MTDRSPRTARVTINVIFLVLVVIFIGLYLRDFDYNLLRGRAPSPAWMLTASALAMASRYWGVAIWRTILVDLGAGGLPGFRVLSAVYARAWLGRYIPGKVAWIAGKVYFASSHGVSKQKLAVASVLEALAQVVSIMALSLSFLAFDSRFDNVDPTIRTAMVAGGIAISFSLVPPIFNRLSALALRVLGRRLADAQVSSKLVAKAFGLYSVGYFLSGGSYALMTHAFSPLGTGDVLFTIAIFNLAGAIGVMAIIVPSGIGVREGVQLLLLPAIMPKEIALLVTAASRLWSVGVDVAFAAITAILGTKRTGANA